jgi:hypothetical protein
MNDFDQAARYAAKTDPAGFLRWLLPDLDPRLAFRGWLDTRRLPFPGERDRTCDTVADLEDTGGAGRRWAVVVEFQSEPQALMLHRLLDYLSRLNLELQSGAKPGEAHHVAGALLNLTGPVQPDTVDMRLPGMEQYGLSLRVVLRTLREEDAGSALAAIAAGRLDRCVLPWIPLMQGAGDPAIMEQWKQVAMTEPDTYLRGQYGGLALFFAELARRLAEWEHAWRAGTWVNRKWRTAGARRAEAKACWKAG